MKVRIETRTGVVTRVDPLQPDPPIVIELGPNETLVGFDKRRGPIKSGADTIELRWTATVAVTL